MVEARHISLQSVVWQPQILDLGAWDDHQRFFQLTDPGASNVVHDTIDVQLRDLMAARRPAETLSDVELDRLVTAHLAGQPPYEYGSWIYYPWLRRVVHLLPGAEYRELRTDRNRNKITAAEQSVLQRARVGIVGLSAGQASAVTLALEGIGGHFRLADFDTLALSNLNRLRAGCHELGINKSVLAARQMFENDPYLSIEIFPDGITDETIDAFLGEGDERLDLLVEGMRRFSDEIAAA